MRLIFDQILTFMTVLRFLKRPAVVCSVLLFSGRPHLRGLTKYRVDAVSTVYLPYRPLAKATSHFTSLQFILKKTQFVTQFSI